jgi:Cu/Ag efflux pump CusA
MISILAAALRFRLLVLTAAAGVMALGIVSLRSTPVDVLPEFAPPYAEIQTEALGLSAEEVEQLITVPLEADLLNGVEGVEVIRSQSLPGLSSIVLVFEPGTDVYKGRQLIEERLTQAHALPNVSKPPTLLQPLSTSSRVLMVALSSDEASTIEQSVIARWTIRPVLMGVPGVANVSVWGMRDQQLQVQVDPEQLREQGVTLNQVVSSAGNAQVVTPLSFLEGSTPGSGGFIETPQQRLQVRHLIEKIASPAALGRVPVEGTGGKLQLADVADIIVGHPPLIGDAVVDGGPGLMLVVEKFPEASTREVTEGVEDALEQMQPGLTEMQMDTSIYRPASYIDDSLNTLGLTAAIGGALLVIALVACRFRWRSVVIAVVTIPLSLLTAVLVMNLLGQGMNAIAFAGLAAAVAIVVDEAVVPTDRVMRTLRQRRTEAEDTATSDTVIEASAHARRPLMFATLIALLAIVPVVVMQGRPGDFFGPLAAAYALAVLAAMVVALTVGPALTYVLVSRWQPAGKESRLSATVKRRYLASLRSFSRLRRLPLIAAGGLVVVGILLVPFTGLSPIPSFKDPDVLIELEAAPGTSNDRMTEVTADVVAAVEAVPGVERVGAHVGRAITGDRHTNVNASDVWVRIDSDADYDATVERVEDAVAQVNDAEAEMLTASSKSIRDVGAVLSGENTVGSGSLAVLTGTDDPLAVRVFGQDLDVLREQATQVQNAMQEVDGIVDPQMELPATEPTIQIEVDLERAQEHGVTPGHVRRAEATLLQGIQVGSVFEEQKVFDVIVMGTPATRDSLGDVRNMLLDTPEGGYVRLGQVADVRVTESPSVIERDAVSRFIDVTADVSGRGTDAITADLENRLAELDFPLEYHAQVRADSVAQEAGGWRILGFGVASVIAMLLLMQALFGSWRLAALVLVLLPIGLVGGLFAALVDGLELSLGSMAGFLAAFGLATRMSLLLVERLRTLELEGGYPGRADLIGRVARERLTPTLTSVAAVAALALPFVVLGSRPGLEIAHPLAVVFLGALITSTATTLFLLPALYLHFAPAMEAGAVVLEEPVKPADENGNGVPGSDELSAAGERAP